MGTQDEYDLRDQLASQALAGLLAGSAGDSRFLTRDVDSPCCKFDRKISAARYAETAYIIADAMLAARQK